MDEKTRKVLLIHKTLIEKIIDRLTALERLSSQGGHHRASAQRDGEGNGVDPSERTDDEKTLCDVQPGARHEYYRDSSGA